MIQQSLQLRRGDTGVSLDGKPPRRGNDLPYAELRNHLEDDGVNDAHRSHGNRYRVEHVLRLETGQCGGVPRATDEVGSVDCGIARLQPGWVSDRDVTFDPPLFTAGSDQVNGAHGIDQELPCELATVGRG